MPRRRPARCTFGTVISHLGVIVAVSAVLGVLVAGLVIPFVGAIGYGASATADGRCRTCPRSSRPRRWPSAPGCWTATATPIATFYDENRVNVPLDQGRADHAAGDRRDRGLPLLPARRARPEGHAARVREQPDQRRRHPGWLLDHPADGQDDPARAGAHRGRAQGGHREHLPAQDPGAAPRHRLRAELLQGLDPRALPQPRLLRRRRLRHPGGGPALLLGQRQPAQHHARPRRSPAW